MAFEHAEQKVLITEQEEQTRLFLKKLLSQTPQLGLTYPTAQVRQPAPV